MIREKRELARPDFWQPCLSRGFPDALKRRLQALGVTEIDDPDKSRFFQASGGRIFRLSPMDGGL